MYFEWGTVKYVSWAEFVFNILNKITDSALILHNKMIRMDQADETKKGETFWETN